MIIRPKIIAPDTSHWANWIDAALGHDVAARDMARGLHDRLVECGRIPFLSWHHLEELLVIDDPANARARASYLQSLPLIAWMQMPGESLFGGAPNILAAEAIAYDAGGRNLEDIRDHVRAQLLKSGPGFDAIGRDGRVWDVVRPIMRGQRLHAGMVAALSGMKTMNDRQTVGEVSSLPVRPPSERARMMAVIHRDAFMRAKNADARRSDEEALAIANEFSDRVIEEMPSEDVSVRQLLTEAYVRQGVDEDEVRDECTIAELSELGTFRSHLRVIADKAGLAFEQLKMVRMESLPSWRISDALKRHGQERRQRPGSDVHDQHLAVLATYTDELYVDKRMHEDFRRVTSKEPDLARLFGAIRKASFFGQILD